MECCVLCNGYVGLYGHNPAPLSEEGRCCDDCNKNHVIPARLSWMLSRYSENL